MIRAKQVAVGFLGLLIFSCQNNSEEELLRQQNRFVVNDSRFFIDEKPDQGQVIGTVDASSVEGDLSFMLVSQSPTDAIELDSNTGVITVSNEALFVFDDNPEIQLSVSVDNGIETKLASITILINDPTGPTFNIWTGSKITFTKQNETDPNEPANQDRITDNVWITRGNNGGQIFNINVESSAEKSESPTDTEWAKGTTENIADLNFAPFRDAVSPKTVANQDLVLHLITDDIYIDIKFLSWSQGKRGGFSYERSTED